MAPKNPKRIRFTLPLFFERIDLSKELEAKVCQLRELHGKTVLIQEGNHYPAGTFMQAQIRIDPNDKKHFYIMMPDFKVNACSQQRLSYDSPFEIMVEHPGRYPDRKLTLREITPGL